MKRIILALAFASFTLAAFAGLAAPPTPPTQNVNVVNATLPVKVTNTETSPVSVSVVNGTSYQAVSGAVWLYVPAGTNAGGGLLYRNSGSAAVILTAISGFSGATCDSVDEPVHANLVINGRESGMEFLAFFDKAPRKDICVYIVNFPGQMVLGPGDELSVYLVLKNDTQFNRSGSFWAVGHTLP